MPDRLTTQPPKPVLSDLPRALPRKFPSGLCVLMQLPPGFIETAMTDKLTDEVKKDYANAIPLGRMGSPEDIANAVLYLASDLSSYVTGQVIRVDGGLIM